MMSMMIVHHIKIRLPMLRLRAKRNLKRTILMIITCFSKLLTLSETLVKMETKIRQKCEHLILIILNNLTIQTLKVSRSKVQNPTAQHIRNLTKIY